MTKDFEDADDFAEDEFAEDDFTDESLKAKLFKTACWHLVHGRTYCWWKKSCTTWMYETL